MEITQLTPMKSDNIPTISPNTSTIKKNQLKINENNNNDHHHNNKEAAFSDRLERLKNNDNISPIDFRQDNNEIYTHNKSKSDYLGKPSTDRKEYKSKALQRIINNKQIEKSESKSQSMEKDSLI